MNVAKINFEKSVLNHWSKKNECVEKMISGCVMDRQTRVLQHTYNNLQHFGLRSRSYRTNDGLISYYLKSFAPQ
jgi:hypothetical protein